jgi:hypothetical protein
VGKEQAGVISECCVGILLEGLKKTTINLSGLLMMRRGTSGTLARKSRIASNSTLAYVYKQLNEM